jgi:hypothetical protein
VPTLLACAVTLAGVMLLFALRSDPAAAAHPCRPISVGAESVTARVGTVRVSCPIGREVATEAYLKIEERGPRPGNQNFEVQGFRCQAVLAETELSCRAGPRRWVFASTQSTDHPSEWNPPPMPSRECGGIARAEGFMILAATPRTTCHFARAAAKKVRYVAFHNGGHGIPDRFHIRVAGRSMTCRNTYAGRIEKIICRGRQREMAMEYTSP